MSVNTNQMKKSDKNINAFVKKNAKINMFQNVTI